MFLFESLTWYSGIMWFIVLGGLIFFNELARLSKWFSLVLFLLVPITLTIFVWPHTAGSGSPVGTWFHWVKVYSALAGCLGFLAIRFIPGLSSNKYALMFPPFILALNISEAVIRDFQCYSFNGFVDGMIIMGGPWNIINGIAGILSIITITGWMGIVIGKDKKKDMIWPDMLWFWVIAYDIWNFAYVYNCVPNHSYYAGAALLISATIPALFIKKGTYLQARAQTLAIWMMFTMAFPTFAGQSIFAAHASYNPVAFMTVSTLALAANIGVFVYTYYKIFKDKQNPFKQPIHSDLKAYQEIIEANK